MKTFSVYKNIGQVITNHTFTNNGSFTLSEDTPGTITLVGAGGFSYGLYSGDFAGGYMGHQAICGGQGTVLKVAGVFPKGVYRVEIGVLGGGTDVFPRVYSNVKFPPVGVGNQSLSTKLYLNNELIMLAAGGATFNYIYVGNQKKDGPRYAASGQTATDTSFIHNRFSGFNKLQINGKAPKTAISSAWTITSSHPAPYLDYGKPNDVTTSVGLYYSVTYNVKNGSGGYVNFINQIQDLANSEIITKPNTYTFFDGTRYYRSLIQ